MIIKFHQAHKTHRSILKTSWKNPANILRTSREHLENIKRASIEYLEKIQKHLWSSENISEHLRRISEHILILYRISVIKWGHPEKKCPHRGWWEQLRNHHRYFIDVLLMFSRCSQDVCRDFPGCFQDAPMGLIGLVEFDDHFKWK